MVKSSGHLYLFAGSTPFPTVQDREELQGRRGAHTVDEFRDPTTTTYTELVDIVRRLAAEPRQL